MGSLFSVFDPSNGIGALSINWISMLRVLSIPSRFWLLSSKPERVVNLIWSGLAAEVKLNRFKGVPNSIPLLLVRVFTLILCNNFLGLVPYVFTASRHPAFTRVLALSSWAGYVIYSTIINTSRFLAHLAPVGTPKILIPFMVLIELVRSVIRPLTLAVRLAANMVAGHLLLVLTRRPMPNLSGLILGVVFVGLSGLVILELGVSFIQRYVFIRLSSLYVGEVQARNL